jgi:hypothetical protein
LRIYPARGAEMYDPYFASPRPYNKVINKVLFSDEVVKNYGKLAMFSNSSNAVVPEKSLGYEMKLPPTTYEQYKKINQEKSSNNAASNNNLRPRQIQSASNKDREQNMGL